MAVRLLAAALLALAGCGGGDDRRGDDRPTPEPTFANPRGDRESAPGAVTVSAPQGGAPEFDQASLEAAAGEVTFEFTNPSAISHSLCVESDDVGTLGCTALFRSDRATLRLRLEPDRYAFFCSAPGHREAGMEGSLTVR